MSNAHIPWPVMMVPDCARRLIDQNCHQCDDRNGWATLYAYISGLLPSFHNSSYVAEVYCNRLMSGRYDSENFPMIDPRDTLQGHHLYYDNAARGWRISFWCAT